MKAKKNSVKGKRPDKRSVKDLPTSKAKDVTQTLRG